MIDDVKKLLQELIVPELNEIKLKVSTLETKIEEMDKRLTTQIGDVDKRINARIDEMDKRIDARFNSLEIRIENLEKRLDTAINLHERIALIEGKLGIH